ncbi:beta-lactamase domain protein [Pseudonocardia dioxanivorans CB1190]|uniref:Beta-lactamase domain protein n=1 Tax=Pseudonocardia dioxanivorans (strain ATCC 55486 / DSM 44775 / JCM 13855 / CB1190) TaxID=675635 RepID=F4CRM4_PSEUX|nr:MBL fold metallo-hydrolase [Pseudonocardia dioxanivorans]AEA26232.1 beta-lactamase domain protein [Pseudonocardia dioxanivorans CB1190]
MSRDLQWAVHVTPGRPYVTSDLPPDLTEREWSPISSTLLHGEREALLVDVPLTAAQATALADWVETFDRTLTTVYVTHAHGDHWFGLSTLLGRFPGARAVATPTVVAAIGRQHTPDFVESFWEARFPGAIPDTLVVPEALPAPELALEGHEIRIVDLGHTDTDDTTALHVPALDLVVAGDAAYNDVHLYLAESPAPQRAQWRAALEKIAALDPRTVVAGHKRPTRDDPASIVAETVQYLEDFEEALQRADSAERLYRLMLDAHGGRVNRGALWGSARAALG